MTTTPLPDSAAEAAPDAARASLPLPAATDRAETLDDQRLASLFRLSSQAGQAHPLHDLLRRYRAAERAGECAGERR
jgi:hypothetical protein